METLIEKNSKITDHDVKTLVEETIKVFGELNDFTLFNNYQRTNNPGDVSIELIDIAIKSLTLNERRRLKKKINIFRKKQSLESANRLYHQIFAKVLKSDLRVKLEYPAKHLLIQKRRETYLNYRLQMETALAEYKKEKGDYYLTRLDQGKNLQ